MADSCSGSAHFCSKSAHLSCTVSNKAHFIAGLFDAMAAEIRPQRNAKLLANAAWDGLVSRSSTGGTGQKRGRKPGQVDEVPRKKKGSSTSTSRAWNMGESASVSTHEHQAHWAQVTRHLQCVKPVLEGLKQMSAVDKKSVRSLLDQIESRSKAQKRQHKSADAVSRQTINQRLKRMEEDMGGDVIQ